MRYVLEYLAALGLALALVFVVLGLRFGVRGWSIVAADQVALLSDLARGERHVLATPGLRLYVPWFQDLRRVSRAPAQVRFGGSEAEQPMLVVRAADGTTFHFEQLVLRFALDVSQAARSADDVGPSEADRRRLVLALARGVLGDEFGRYTAEEIVVGANLDAARTAARLRLNASLAPHGITVFEIPPALPRFDADYEQQVLRRRVAEQQVELVRAERAKLEGELAQKREKASREKEIELAVLAGELARQRTAAGTAAVARLREAEVYALGRREEARTERAHLEDRAAGLAARTAAEVEGLDARVQALAQRGPSAVREAWIQTLSGVSLEIAPRSEARRAGEEPR